MKLPVYHNLPIYQTPIYPSKYYLIHTKIKPKLSARLYQIMKIEIVKCSNAQIASTVLKYLRRILALTFIVISKSAETVLTIV